MVPYVRKSFYKHFIDGLNYIEELNVKKLFEKEDVINHSIEEECYKKHERAYKFALDKTIQETEQAVEGMYHNLK